MPIEIKVGPPYLTISQGRTFMVTDPRGYIEPDTEQGVYALDTRFVSFYYLYINRLPLKAITSSQLSFYASRMHLSNPLINTEGGLVDENTISVTINRTVSEGIHEEFAITNYSGKHVKFLLELAMRCDFADIFEVKSGNIVQRGKQQSQWHEEEGLLRTTYDDKDFHRATGYQIANSSSFHCGYANGRIFFEIELNQNETWYMSGDIILEHGDQVKKAPSAHTSVHQGTATTGAAEQELDGDLDERQARWRARCTNITTTNNNMYRMYRQAIDDMGALRIYDLDVSDEAWVPAAGVPWFVTLFGRDSLTVSYQNMAVAEEFARGALYRLAQYQGKIREDWRDEQPGKIMHEIRFGELAFFHKIPFTPYYGTADATILYLIVLSETYRWTGNIDLLKEYRQAAEDCLNWIDHYGDLDGDGFQEYKTYSPVGYSNMGWKDAGDAVVYADGTQVLQPKGTCELQGYVYDAKIRMAEVFSALGDEARAQALRDQAETLKRKFNEVFWMEDEGCYAYAIDPSKKLVTSIASNAGQVLWSGIADQDKAERTAQRLLQEDMWSGWGIRTLSSKNPAYDPFSYQRGSVWPQDNGIIAAGFKRYGMPDKANKVIRATFDAIERFDAYRPPELFAGLKRQGQLISFPVLYPPGANIPQAWASGSIFHMLRTILGIRADVPHRKLYVAPTLPDWLPDIELQHMHVGPCSLDIRFWLEKGKSRWEVVSNQIIPGKESEERVTVMDDPERPVGSSNP